MVVGIGSSEIAVAASYAQARVCVRPRNALSSGEACQPAEILMKITRISCMTGTLVTTRRRPVATSLGLRHESVFGRRKWAIALSLDITWRLR
jgi:hypothetical protein